MAVNLLVDNKTAYCVEGHGLELSVSFNKLGGSATFLQRLKLNEVIISTG